MCANVDVLCLCRIADPDQPVLWLDQMPARSLSRGFNNHINLIRYESFTKQHSHTYWGAVPEITSSLWNSILQHWMYMCLLFYIYFTFSDGTFGICAQFSLMTFPLFPEFQLYKWVIAVSNKDPEYVYFHMLLLFPK